MESEAPVRSSRKIARQYAEMDPLASDVVINIVHTGTLLADEIARRLRPYHVTQTGFRILAILLIAEQPLRPVEIAERLRITRGTVTGLLDSLERRDLIRRVAHPDDRRMLHIELTDTGRHLQREMLPAQFQAENDICAPLGEHEREMLVQLLGKLQASLLELSGRERHERPHHAQPLAAANDDTQ